MSPEQASGTQELDSRSDVYSLACVMYEMLAGDPPFTGPTAPAIIARQMVDPVPSLRTVRPTVPEELERAIEKALAKVPADRYETAGAFVEAAGAAQVEVVPTRERRVPRRRVSPRAWRVGAAAAAVLIVIAVVLSRMTASTPISITTSNIIHVTSDPGLEFQPAISPDGEEVAYVVGPIGNARLVVRSTIEVGSGGGTRPGEEVGGTHWLPAWTPDGASLRFMARTLGSWCDWKEV
jgi:serine/threonine-protein kinase